MAKLYNLARMTTATTGTGTLTLGTAVSGYLTFAQAGVSNAETVAYGIKDGSSSEVGTGVYTSAGTTLTRSVTKSTNSDTAISLSGSAEVYVTARKEDILNAADPLTSAQAAVQSDQEAASSTTLAVTPGTQKYHPSAAKAWVSFTDSAGTITINASYNVSSVTRNGTGDYTVNFTTAFSSAEYCAVTSFAASTSVVCKMNAQSSGATVAATASAQRFALFAAFAGGASTNCDRGYYAAFGDQ
jgi:hypothetical protein